MIIPRKPFNDENFFQHVSQDVCDVFLSQQTPESLQSFPLKINPELFLETLMMKIRGWQKNHIRSEANRVCLFPFGFTCSDFEEKGATSCQLACYFCEMETYGTEERVETDADASIIT